MDPRFTIRSYLKAARESWSQEASDSLGLVYRGPADFVLQEGCWWKPAKPRPPYKQGVARACYGNSIAAAVLFGLRYVQGYAVSPQVPSLVVPHAWNADAEGRAIDVTWWPTGIAYLGVEMSVERADDATWHGDADPIDDFMRGWPLLKTKWRGELAVPDPSWKPSRSLLALQARARGDEDECDRQWHLAELELEAELS